MPERRSHQHDRKRESRAEAGTISRRARTGGDPINARRREDDSRRPRRRQVRAFASSPRAARAAYTG